MVSKSEEQIAKNAATRAVIIAIIAVIIVVGLFIGNYLIGQSINNPEKQSAFGSQFGAAAALFSGLAFVGLIYAILLQSQELRLQREELKLTRKEMEETREEIEGQKKALELQSETMVKQQFESSFFIILDRLNNKSANLISFKLETTEGDSRGLFFAANTLLQKKFLVKSYLILDIREYLKQMCSHHSEFISY